MLARIQQALGQGSSDMGPPSPKFGQHPLPDSPMVSELNGRLSPTDPYLAAPTPALRPVNPKKPVPAPRPKSSADVSGLQTSLSSSSLNPSPVPSPIAPKPKFFGGSLRLNASQIASTFGTLDSPIDIDTVGPSTTTLPPAEKGKRNSIFGGLVKKN